MKNGIERRSFTLSSDKINFLLNDNKGIETEAIQLNIWKVASNQKKVR